jgi:3-oxoacyl-[acyl-carrier protein] reductase
MSGWDFTWAIVPVTGAAAGIGCAAARRLRQEGATPLLLDISGLALAAAAEDLYIGHANPWRHAYEVDV